MPKPLEFDFKGLVISFPPPEPYEIRDKGGEIERVGTTRTLCWLPDGDWQREPQFAKVPDNWRDRVQECGFLGRISGRAAAAARSRNDQGVMDVKVVYVYENAPEGPIDPETGEILGRQGEGGR